MSNFKGTKGQWEIIKHSWSDSSITCGNKIIATNSIYCEATEETQEVLESEMSANFRLMAKAPEMLAMLEELLRDLEDEVLSTAIQDTVKRAGQLIKQATEI